MLPELLGRAIWGLGRLAVKYVVVPAAITVAGAYLLGGLAERVRRQKADGVPNGQAHLEV